MSEIPQTPPPPPSGGSSPASSGMSADSVKAAVQRANPLDLGIVGAGVLAFLFSLLPYYKASTSGILGSTSASATAWHGFFGWFAALTALAVAVLVALHLLGIRPLAASLTRLIALGGFALATLCIFLALFVIPGKVDLAGVDYGHGIGYWLSFLVILGGLALSFLRKDARD